MTEHVGVEEPKHRVISGDDYKNKLMELAEGDDPELAFLAGITINQLGELHRRNTELGKLLFETKNPGGTIAKLRLQVKALEKGLRRKKRYVEQLKRTARTKDDAEDGYLDYIKAANVRMDRMAKLLVEAGHPEFANDILSLKLIQDEIEEVAVE